MTVVCTPCCAEKRADPGLLPAVERYVHPRIAWCAAEARACGEPLFILSGRFGLVPADEPIPWYDHAMSEDDVPVLVPAAARLLLAAGVRTVRFVARPAGTPGWAPYHAAMAAACAQAGARLAPEPWPR